MTTVTGASRALYTNANAKGAEDNHIQTNSVETNSVETNSVETRNDPKGADVGGSISDSSSANRVRQGPVLQPSEAPATLGGSQSSTLGMSLQSVLNSVEALLTPEVLTLAKTRRSAQQMALSEFVETGEATGKLAPLAEEKQKWVDQVSTELQSNLGLTLPELVGAIDQSINPYSAKCSALFEPGENRQYVLSFGASEYAFIKATVAHELGHAHLDGVIASSPSVAGIYWRLHSNLRRLTQAADADSTFRLRSALQDVEKQLGGTGSTLSRFLSPYHNFVLDSYHELYADFVACLAEQNPDAMFEAEQIAQSQNGTVDDQWEMRRFSKHTETPPANESYAHTSLVAARAPLWQTAQQARAAGLSDQAVLRQLERSIVAALDSHVEEARDFEFPRNAERYASSLVENFRLGLARLTPQRELWSGVSAL